MTPNQKLYITWLRIFAITLIASISMMALMGGYGEVAPYEVLWSSR